MDTQKLTALAISDSGFIFDPTSGNSYTTNQIGMIIIQKLKENKDIPEIMKAIHNEYEIDKNDLEVDLMDFIQNLKKYYLISE